MSQQKQWEPPLEFPDWKLWWRRKQTRIVKPVFVGYNGNKNRSLEEIKKYALYQSLNILRGFKVEDLEIVDLFESVKAGGWVVVVQNKT